MIKENSAKAPSRRRPAQRPARGDTRTPRALGEHLLKSVAISLLTALLSLAVLSLAAYFTEDPAALLLPMGLTAAAITAFTGGFAAVRLHRKSALLCGLSNGCTMLAIMLVLSLFFGNASSAHSPLTSILLHAGYLLLSVLGAFVALPRTAGTPRKRHSPRRR